MTINARISSLKIILGQFESDCMSDVMYTQVWYGLFDKAKPKKRSDLMCILTNTDQIVDKIMNEQEKKTNSNQTTQRDNVVNSIC